MKVVERDMAINLRITAVQTIDGLSKKVNFSEHASRIIHPLVRVLSDANTPAELSAAIMETLRVLLVQLGTDFAIFIPMINKVCDDLFRPSSEYFLTLLAHSAFFATPASIIRSMTRWLRVS